jgi:hypothetical protein
VGVLVRRRRRRLDENGNRFTRRRGGAEKGALEGRRACQRLVTGYRGCKAREQPLSPRSPRLRVRRGRILTLPPIGNGSGRRCPHRHWEWLRNGDEDVATPFRAGAVTGCARETASAWLRLRGFAAYPSSCFGMPKIDSRRGAEAQRKGGRSGIVIEPAIGGPVQGCPRARFPVALRGSAPLRENSAA